jgi:hypothetical protein
MPFEITFPLREIMQRAGVGDEELAKELRLDRNHVAAIKNGVWKRLTPRELRRLGVWAARHGANLPMVRPNPLWATLTGGSVRLYPTAHPRGSGRKWEAEAEGKLADVFHRIGCQTEPTGHLSPDSIIDSIRSANCVFIGSPKSNVATEFALAALFGIKPGNPSSPIEDSRFKFHWPNPSMLSNSSSFGRNIQRKEDPGIRVAGAGRSHFIDASYIDPDQFLAWKGRGGDIGVVVVCRKPLDAVADVTTIVLCGFTGFATLDITRAIIEDGVPIFEYQFVPDLAGFPLEPMIPIGQPVIRFMRTTYEKRAGSDSREPVEDSRHWMPPWKSVNVGQPNKHKKSAKKR